MSLRPGGDPSPRIETGPRLSPNRGSGARPPTLYSAQAYWGAAAGRDARHCHGLANGASGNGRPARQAPQRPRLADVHHRKRRSVATTLRPKGYLDPYLRATDEAIARGAEIGAYFLWSLRDNFPNLLDHYPRLGRASCRERV